MTAGEWILLAALACVAVAAGAMICWWITRAQAKVAEIEARRTEAELEIMERDILKRERARTHEEAMGKWKDHFNRPDSQ